MQLHEAGVGPEEAEAASGPSPPLPPAQVMVPSSCFSGGLLRSQKKVTATTQSQLLGWW